jgi:uncharacterized protein YndB with AHSA1/START domain
VSADAERHGEPDAARGEGLHRRHVEVVEVVVRHEHHVDRRQRLEGPAPPGPMGSEGNHRVAFRRRRRQPATRRLCMSTDRIEKKIVLRAPRSRVWRALANAAEFGAWFRVTLDGTAFTPGARVTGKIGEPGYEQWPFEITVERVEPERLLSYRWHPYPQPGVDLGSEPTTLVEFRLEEVPGGTELTVVESGFDRLPLARRAEAFRMNEGGWSEQLRRIERHVSA